MDSGKKQNELPNFDLSPEDDGENHGEEEQPETADGKTVGKTIASIKGTVSSFFTPKKAAAVRPAIDLTGNVEVIERSPLSSPSSENDVEEQSGDEMSSGGGGEEGEDADATMSDKEEALPKVEMTRRSPRARATKRKVEKEDVDHDSIDELDRKPAAVPTRKSKRTKREYNRHSINGEKHEGLKPCIGMELNKKFNDGVFYHGVIISGPQEIHDEVTNSMQIGWKVKYEDGDCEDLTKEEIAPWVEYVPESEPETKPKPKAGPGSLINTRAPPPPSVSSYEEAKNDLAFRMGVTKDEVIAALDQMKPPYGLNEAMRLIHKAKGDYEPKQEFEKFVPAVGLKIRKLFEGTSYNGVVTRDQELVTDELGNNVKMWEVTYDDDNTKDDMTFEELFMWRASRPIRTNPVRGRQLKSLELFCGCGAVTQEFAERKWQVRSIDNSPSANATDRGVDIMNMSFADIGMVPDFIWASPPCFTYSNLAGGIHRNAERGEFEKTIEAHENNSYFTRMAYIMRWAKKKNPNLIVCIENPVGQMAKVPLMKELTKDLGLYKVIVHYCALGRDDKKPTVIWTNDYKLKCTLSEFTCELKCPYAGGCHPIGVRNNGSQFNAAAIPQALAEEVAEHCSATFYDRRIRYTEDVRLTPEEEQEFNEIMKKSE